MAPSGVTPTVTRVVETLLVTGGHGFLGRRVVARASAAGWHVVAPSSAVLDVRDAAGIVEAIDAHRPAAVVHLAYRRDERDTIVEGATNVGRAAHSIAARLVHLSTDVVFGGGPAAYRETTPLDPLDDYGRAKAEAERAVESAHPPTAIVRTSLLYSTDRDDPGRPVRDVEAALAGSPFAFFTDEVRCPAAVDDVAAAVVALAGPLREVEGPVHVAGPVAIDRHRLATLIARWLGHGDATLTAGTHAALGVTRPGRVVLDTTLAAGLGLRCRSPEEVLAPPSGRALRRRSS
jgi:dTDP-4-dehydrorhamnose reductase